jgi:hypothetical protein
MQAGNLLRTLSNIVPHLRAAGQSRDRFVGRRQDSLSLAAISEWRKIAITPTYAPSHPCRESMSVNACLQQSVNNRKIFCQLAHGRLRFESPTSELYNDAGGYPALPVLSLVAELSHKPICLHQAQSDPFPKPDV